MCEVQFPQWKHNTGFPRPLLEAVRSPEKHGRIGPTRSTRVSIDLWRPLRHSQVVLRHDLVTRARAPTQLLARVAMTQDMLWVIESDSPFYLPAMATTSVTRRRI